MLRPGACPVRVAVCTTARGDTAPGAHDSPHCALDPPATMYSVVHCLGALFMNTIYGHCLKKKKSTKVTPRIWGITTWYRSLSMRIPRTRWGTGLDDAFTVHFDEINMRDMSDMCMIV